MGMKWLLGLALDAKAVLFLFPYRGTGRVVHLFESQIQPFGLEDPEDGAEEVANILFQLGVLPRGILE